MLCEIARNLADEKLEEIQTLEGDLGVTLVAFSCRSLEPAREERLRKTMEDYGLSSTTVPAPADEAQLQKIREAEAALGLALVAVRT